MDNLSTDDIIEFLAENAIAGIEQDDDGVHFFNQQGTLIFTIPFAKGDD